MLRLTPKNVSSNRFITLNQKLRELSAELEKRRSVEAELREQWEWLRVTLASIGDAVIATDTNACITLMNGVAELLTGWNREEAVGEPLDEIFRIILSPVAPARAGVEQVESAATRAADLCRQLLAYSGKGQFVVRPFDLSELVDELGHLLEVAISKNVVLRYDLGEDLPAINADVSRIQQVVMNLITNASEAIEKKSGIVTISTGVMDIDRGYLSKTFFDDGLSEGRYVFLEVSDTGRGMDAETKEKVFDPFFTTKFTGRGLGMAAVLGIVRSHKGTIKCCSEPGRGSTFKVLIPAVDLPAVAITKKNATVSEWTGSGTALIVDDEEVIRTVASQILERCGFRVLTANDGSQGLDVFREHADEITFVLLDMTMPKLNGEATFRELRRIRKNATVILSSGYNEQEATSRFVSKGLAGFIQKPYRVNDLISTVREVLDE